MPATPPFPLVGVLTPLIMGFGLWAVMGSPFALVGAVLGPAMVLAHYGDGVRRARRESTSRAAREAREAESIRQAQWADVEADRRIANRQHPSVQHLADSPMWVPGMDGRSEVRAGSAARDGVPGFPWLVSVVSGVSVVGDGVAAESVWRSLLVHTSAAHGTGDRSGDSVTWPTGVWLVRGESDVAGVTIRCAGNRVLSVTTRGQLPETGDWVPDDMSSWDVVLARCVTGEGDVAWSDRIRCLTGVGLSGGAPYTLDLSSSDPHVVVCGRTGTGKSEFLAALLCDWAERFTPAELSWVGIDFKGGATLSPLGSLNNCRAVVTDLEPAIIDRVLCGIATELTDRERTLRLKGVSRVEDSAELDRLVVVVDEFPELIRQFPQATEVLSNIARRGRSLGVHILVTTQHPNAVHRDALIANIPVRVCFPLASAHDVSAVVGGPAAMAPSIGRPIVVRSDGRQHRVVVRRGASPASTAEKNGARLDPPWRAPLHPPLVGSDGFGRIDDVRQRAQPAARWGPSDGDIVVVGRRGSGKSTALMALCSGFDVSVATSIDDISRTQGVVVIDDLDRIHGELPDSRKHELAALLSSRRLEPNAPTFVLSVTNWSPRLHGLVPNVLVLGVPNRDAHVATGEPPETFDPSAKPGVGSWRGRRVVVYARTDSMVTESIP